LELQPFAFSATLEVKTLEFCWTPIKKTTKKQTNKNTQSANQTVAFVSVNIFLIDIHKNARF